MSRRQFLKVTATSLAGSSLALLGFSPTQALAEVRQYKLARTVETRNTCPYCSVGCGILMYGLGDGAKNAQSSIIHIEGDPTIRSIAARCARRARPDRLHPQPEPPDVPSTARRARTSGSASRGTTRWTASPS
jgi:anaerobic selenocysteine-containing dehydrogenase